jgi:hypothetical protein
MFSSLDYKNAFFGWRFSLSSLSSGGRKILLGAHWTSFPLKCIKLLKQKSMRIFSLTLNCFIEEKQLGAYQQVFLSRNNEENVLFLNELHIFGWAGIILAFL